MSSLKTALRTALLLVQRRNETLLQNESLSQHENARRSALADAQVKGLVDDAIRWGDAHQSPQDSLGDSESSDTLTDHDSSDSLNEYDSSESLGESDSHTLKDQTLDSHTWWPSFITMYNEVEPRDDNVSLTSTSSSQFAPPFETPLHCSPYVIGSPVFIGEVGTGLYAQQSAVSNRSGFVFHDLGGVARNAYEIFLRLCPMKRPLLIGTIGSDESGKKIKNSHGNWNDLLEGIKTVSGQTLEIRGFYNKYGFKEQEFRSLAESAVSSAQLMEWKDSLQSASSVFADTSLSTDAQRKLVTLLEASPTKVFVNPCDCHRLSSLLDSSLLQRTDYLFVSIPELWEIATLCKPELQSKRDEWNERCTL